MAKTATIQARVEPNLKADVEKIFTKLGVSATDVITMLYSQIKLREGLPFEVAVPTTTRKKKTQQECS